MNKKLLLLIVLLCAGTWLSAQAEHRALRRGDKAYKGKEYDVAEKEYRDALNEENSAKGNYNLGNALYEKGDFEGAAKRYEEAATLSDNDNVKSRSYRNLGDSYYRQEDYENAAEAYKQSLRINPEDVEAKYNLSKTIRQIQEQQQQQQQDQQDQDQQDQDQQDQDQQQQGQGQQDQQNQDQNGEQGDQEQQQDGNQSGDQQQQPPEQESGQGESRANPDQPSMSREEAERQLGIAEEAEKETMRRLQQSERAGCTGDKDW